MAEDSELWDIVLDGRFITTFKVRDGEITRVFPKTRHQYSEANKKNIEKRYKSKKFLVVV